MIKKYVKIKPEITLADEEKAINFIVNSIFDNGEYKPWNKEFALICAIAKYFIEGINFEKNDVIYDCVMEDQLLKTLVNKFFYDVDKDEKKNDKNFEYINIKNHVMNSVDILVNFRLQKMIHCTDEQHELYKGVSEMLESISEIGKNISLAVQPIITNPENAKAMIGVLKKMNDSKTLSKKAIQDIFVDTVMEVQKKMKQ